MVEDKDAKLSQFANNFSSESLCAPLAIERYNIRLNFEFCPIVEARNTFA